MERSRAKKRTKVELTAERRSAFFSFSYLDVQRSISNLKNYKLKKKKTVKASDEVAAVTLGGFQLREPWGVSVHCVRVQLRECHVRRRSPQICGSDKQHLPSGNCSSSIRPFFRGGLKHLPPPSPLLLPFGKTGSQGQFQREVSTKAEVSRPEEDFWMGVASVAAP